MTFVTFIDPDRGHVTSRGHSLFAMSKDQGIRDLRVRVKNSVIRIFSYDLDGGHAAHALCMRLIGPVGVVHYFSIYQPRDLHASRDLHALNKPRPARAAHNL